MRRELLSIAIALCIGLGFGPGLEGTARAQTWGTSHARSLILLGSGTDLTHTLTIQAPTITSSLTLIFPPANLGGILSNDGSGNLSWTTTATANQLLLSGASGVPTWSTATFPTTTTVNQLLWSSTANTVAGLTTTGNGALVTDNSGVPSISQTLPTAVQSNIAQLGTITSGVWHGTPIAAAYGGIGTDLTGVTDGQLLIGQTSDHTLALANLTPGTNMLITNGGHSISLATVNNPVFSDSVTTPLLLGGTAAGSSLALKSTSNGSPSGDYVAVTTGGLERMRVLSNGYVGIGTSTPSSTFDLHGKFAIMDDTVAVATGATSDNVSSGATSNLHIGLVLTGGSAAPATITGFAGGTEGQQLSVVNYTGYPLTFVNNTGSATGNRIFTGSGNIVLPAFGVLGLVHDDEINGWAVVANPSNTIGAGRTGLTTVTQNGLLYGNGTAALGVTNVLANGILVTDGSGAPSISQTLPSAVLPSITALTGMTGDITYPTALTFNGTAGRTIALNRNTGNSTAGQDLTLQAGAPLTSASTPNLVGGNLTLASGISEGTGSSFIYFQTPTPNVGSASTDNSLTTRLTINSNRINIGSGVEFSMNGTQRISSSGVGTLASLSLGTALTIANGGTNGTATPTNGGVAYGTGTAYAFSSAGLSGQMLVSAGAASPVWSTATYPSTTTANQLLYSSSTNTVAGLTSGNNGILITSGAGAPSISQTLPSAVQGNITSVGTIASGVWHGTPIGTAYGGLGTDISGATDGQLLIGQTSDNTLALATLTAGTNMVVTNGGHSISLATVTNPVFSDSVTTPLVLGGTASGSHLALKSTYNASPSGDYVSVTTGGAERLRVLSGGQVGIGMSAPVTTLDLNGTFAIEPSSTTITGGIPNNDVVLGGTSYVHILRSGPASAASITGFAAGHAGEQLRIENRTGQDLTLVNNSGASVAGNKIQTISGSDITLAADDEAILFYDGESTTWRLQSVGGISKVPLGGTGATSFAANGILFGNGANPLQVTNAAANSVLVTDPSNNPSLSQTLPSAVQGNITSLTGMTGDITYPTALTFNGTSGRTITMNRNTGNSTAGQGLTIQAGAPLVTPSTNNLAGGDLTLASGISEGSGNSRIFFQTPVPNGLTANTDNSLATRLTINSTQINLGSGIDFLMNGTQRISSAGAGTLASLTLGSALTLSNGGTGAALTASNGGIFYSTGSAAAILSGTATANRVLLSGSSAAPAWSTATYPASTTANQLLYSSADNTIAGLTSGNNGVLITSGAGAPSISSTLPSAVQGNITSTGTIGSGTWNGGTIDIGYGGTGQTTAAAALKALAPDTSSHTLEFLHIKAGGGFEWAPPSAGPGVVTSVDVSGGSTGLTTSGGPITTSGTITLGGTLDIGYGGTGQTTRAAALKALLPDTAGNTAMRLTVLAGGGIGWIAGGTSGTVTEVNGSGGSTGLTLTGGPITATGTLTLGGTLAVANGGTGQSSGLSAGGVIYGSSSSAMASTSAGTSGQLLISGGAGAPSFTSSVSGLIITNSSIGSSSPSTGAFTTVTASTSATMPIVYGGSAAGSTLNLQSTSNGSPSGDYLTFTTGGTERARLTSTGLGIGMTAPTVALDIHGKMAIAPDSVAINGGATNDNVSSGTTSRLFIKQTGTDAPATITGFTGGTKGSELRVVNMTGQELTLANLSGSSAGNQIITQTGGDVAVQPGATVSFVWNGDYNAWDMNGIGGVIPVGTGGTGVTSLAQNGILYGDGTASVNVTSAAANSVLVTDGANLPSLSQTLPSAVQANITSLSGMNGAITYPTALTFNGTAARTMSLNRNTSNSIAGQALTIQAGAPLLAASTTNLAGGNLTLASGISEGSGNSYIYFQTPTPTGSSSSDNSLATRLTINGTYINLGSGIELDMNGTQRISSSGAGTLASLSLGTALPIASGGTNGTATPTNGGVAYGTGTAYAFSSAGSSGQILRSAGTASPTWSTATYPASTTANQLLYSSSTNTVAGLTSGANGVLVTDGSSVPSISTTIPSATQDNITRLGTITNGVWHGTPIGTAYGGVGIDLSGVTDGQLLIGQTSDNTMALATLTAGTNMVVTNGGHSISLATVTNPVFSDSVTTPLVLGGTAAGSHLALKSTYNASPSGDYLSITTGNSERMRVLSNGNVGIGTATATTSLFVNGTFAIGGDSLTIVGSTTNNDVSRGTKGEIRFGLSGTEGPTTITGFTGGVNGMRLRVVNTTGYPLTLANASVLSAPGNRIITGAGQDAVVSSGSAAEIQWDNTTNAWITDFVGGLNQVTTGGTGTTSFTANGILFGNGMNPLQVTNASANSVLVTDGANAPSLSTTLPAAVQSNITALTGMTGAITYPTALTFNGTAARTMSLNRNTSNSVAGQGLTIQAGAPLASASTSDLAGGNLTLSSGISEGAGTSNIIFQTPTPTGSSSADNSLATRLTINATQFNIGSGMELDMNGTQRISSAGAGTLASLTLGSALTVANGGLGIASGTTGGVPYFSGSTTIASSGALTSGAVVLGGGASGPSALALGTAYQLVGTNSGATAVTNLTLAGTTNQVTVGTAGTTLTLSTPQNIHTAATPQFLRLGLNQVADATASLAATQTALGTTSTNGLILQNTTGATGGIPQQYSPRIVLSGTAYNSSGATSQVDNFAIENQPQTVAGTTTTNLVFTKSIAGGAYSTAATLTSGGVFNPATGFQIGGSAASGNYLRGNGTNFVSSTIQSGDLPGSFTGFANPSVSIGLSATNGSATTAMRSDAAPALSQAIVPTWTGIHTFQQAPGANTSGDGAVLSNVTAASVGSQQFSPRLRLTGQGWKTNATAASEQVDWIMENQPVQGAADPSTNLVFSDRINGGSYSPAANLTSGGVFNVATGFQIGGASATSGHYLRGNGANYVDNTIQSADIPWTTPGTIGSTTASTGAFTSLTATPTGSNVGLTISGSSSGNDVTGGSWSVTHGGVGSFSSLIATTVASGITIGTGVNATSLTSAATGSAKTVSFPNATGNLALVASTTGQIANTDVSGLGTMSTQNAGTVAITGGTINGTTIGGSTPAAGTFTTITGGSSLTLGSDVTPTAGTIVLNDNHSADSRTETIQTKATLGGSWTVTLPDATGNLALIAATNGAIANTDVSGLGTMSTQNASAVAITGGTGAFTSTSTTAALSATNSGVQSSGVTATSISNIATNATANATKTALGITSTGTWTGAGAGINDGLTFSVSGGTTNNDIVGTAGWSVTSAGAGSFASLSASTLAATTAASGITIGTGSNATNLTSAASGGAKTVSFPNANGNLALVASTTGQIAETDVTSLSTDLSNKAAKGANSDITSLTGLTGSNPITFVTGGTRAVSIAQESASTTGDQLSVVAGQGGSTSGTGGFLVLASGAKGGGATDGDIQLKTGGAAGTTQMTVNNAGGVTVNNGNMNVTSGTYKIGGTDVLSSTVLGTGVTTANGLTSASALATVGTITSGIWNAGAVTSSGAVTAGTHQGVDGTSGTAATFRGGNGSSAAGGLATLQGGSSAGTGPLNSGGATVDAGQSIGAGTSTITFKAASPTSGSTVNGSASVATLTNGGFNLVATEAYSIGGTSVLNATTLGTGVTTANGLTSASALATVGTITSGIWNAGAVTSSGALTSTLTSNQIVLGTTNTTTISSTAPAAGRTYTIPDAGGAANFILSTMGSAQTIAGGLTSSGTLTASGSGGLALTNGTPKITLTDVAGLAITDGTNTLFSITDNGTTATTSANIVNAATGFTIAGAAASGNYLRGNSTNFVSSAIQTGDIPWASPGTIGSGTPNTGAFTTLTLSGSTPNVTSTSGTAMTVQPGTTGGTTGAVMTVQGGTGNGTGVGGGTTIAGGTGGATPGNGGDVTISGGMAGTASGTGGQILFRTAPAAAGTTLATRMTITAAGDVNVANNVQTGGTTRLSNSGALSNITSLGLSGAISGGTTYSGSGDITTTTGNLVAGTSSNPGLLKLTNTGGFTATVDATNLSAPRAISLPNNAGTLALVASTAGAIAQSDITGLTTGSSPTFAGLSLGTGALNTVGNITIDGSGARTITVNAPAGTGSGVSLGLNGAAATTTGTGGAVTVAAGAGAGTSGTGGAISVVGGASASGGVNNNLNGGGATIDGGASSGTGTSTITFKAAAAGSSGSGANASASVATLGSGGLSLATGETYQINSTSVLSSTVLGTSVTTANGLTSASALATVGTITSGIWNAGAVTSSSSVGGTTGSFSTSTTSPIIYGTSTANGELSLRSTSSGTHSSDQITFYTNAAVKATLTNAGAFNLASGGTYQINATDVLSATTLGSGVTTASGLTTASSLATVGTITSGIWNAGAVTSSGAVTSASFHGADVAAGTATTFRAGNSSGANAGANATFTGGNAGSSGTGGGAVIAGGTGGTSNAAGGVASVTGGLGGSGGTSGIGGAASLVGGAGSSTSAGAAGGNANVTGGNAGGTGANAGGTVAIAGGTATGAGAGGAVTISGGTASATAGSLGGTVSMTAGNGTSTGTGAAGSAVSLTGGNAGGSGNNAGGNITLTPGTATGTGTAGNVVVTGGLVLTKSTASISGSTNNWALSTAATYFYISSSVPANVTGIVGGVDGREIILVNNGSNTITLKDQNAGSSTPNEFNFNGSDIRLAGNGIVTLIYDGTSSIVGWRAVSTH